VPLEHHLELLGVRRENGKEIGEEENGGVRIAKAVGVVAEAVVRDDLPLGGVGDDGDSVGLGVEGRGNAGRRGDGGVDG